MKLGDGAADLKPIAHLYKTQVYAMARALGLPSELCERQPTTDTYSLEQTQEEFYFQLPYQKMDLVSFGMDNGVDSAVIADKAGLSLIQVDRVMKNIRQKRKVTAQLHFPPFTLVQPKSAVPAQGCDQTNNTEVPCSEGFSKV